MTEQHRSGRSDRLVCTGAWWKLVLVGPIAIVVVIVGSRVGVEMWFLGFFAVMLAGLSMAVGLLLGLSHLVALRRASVRT